MFIGSSYQDFRGIERKAIPVKPWRGQPNDYRLIKLMEYLLALSHEPVLETALKADFYFLND